MGARLGLVLAGGGAKGAYQVGVFRALRELGLDRQVSAVAGTSIGALNAALFLQGDIDAGTGLWTSSRTAMFGRRGLETTLDRYLRADAVANSAVTAHAACLSGFPSGTVRYLRLNGCSEERIRQILRATSAVPVLFPPEVIDGLAYTDGGLGWNADNIPVWPVYNAGCREIIVVYLSPGDQVDPRAFPGARLLEIRPSWSLGRLLSGNLDFRSTSSRWRLELGYRDAMAQLPELLYGKQLSGGGNVPAALPH
jgi:NTE family protein